MNSTEMSTYRHQLLTLRNQLDGDVSHLSDEALRKNGDAGGNLSNTPIHMADLGTDNFEQEFTLSLIESEEGRMKEINAALDRIEHGGFGRCEECQKVIPKARLQALPFTRYCVDCARKLQQSS
jgi:RNA polymerase-binding transcription factor DksA